LDGEYLAPGLTAVPPAGRFVCVARLAAKKGQLLLIDALSRLAAEGRVYELTLVGDGPLRGEIEERIDELGLKRQVKLVGWADAQEVKHHIETARALVLPSLGEGLPVVVTEAFALGRPVVCTDVGGVRELVEHGVNGWVIPPGSVDALAGALKEVMAASPTDLGEMGRRGAARVARDHNAKNETARLVRLFHESAGA
jgi:glycosyltransferase involved in cell wall biosynthesis